MRSDSLSQDLLSIICAVRSESHPIHESREGLRVLYSSFPGAISDVALTFED
jgi:hypothetical protein